MTIRRLARLQSGLSKKSKGRYDPEIVACSWAAVDGVALDWARTKLKVACAQADADPASPSVCKGKADGTYCSDPDRFFGYICKNGAVAKGLQCPPPQHPLRRAVARRAVADLRLKRPFGTGSSPAPASNAPEPPPGGGRGE